jgi:membrane-associated phospholipid phosphatase
MKIKAHKKATIIALMLLALNVPGNAQNWDIDIARNINPQNPNSGYWKTTSGATYFISAAVPFSLLAIGLIEKDAELKNKSYEVFGSIVIELVVSESMKVIFNRMRPAEKYPLVIYPYKNVYGKSFPSGHTSLAFSAAASLSIQCKRWYITVPAYLWAGSVGYSRMYLGVHYPSDVLAGAAVGIGSAYLAHWLNQKLFKKKMQRPG